MAQLVGLRGVAAQGHVATGAGGGLGRGLERPLALVAAPVLGREGHHQLDGVAGEQRALVLRHAEDGVEIIVLGVLGWHRQSALLALLLPLEEDHGGAGVAELQALVHGTRQVRGQEGQARRMRLDVQPRPFEGAALAGRRVQASLRHLGLLQHRRLGHRLGVLEGFLNLADVAGLEVRRTAAPCPAQETLAAAHQRGGFGVAHFVGAQALNALLQALLDVLQGPSLLPRPVRGAIRVEGAAHDPDARFLLRDGAVEPREDVAERHEAPAFVAEAHLPEVRAVALIVGDGALDQVVLLRLLSEVLRPAHDQVIDGSVRLAAQVVLDLVPFIQLPLPERHDARLPAHPQRIAGLHRGQQLLFLLRSVAAKLLLPSRRRLDPCEVVLALQLPQSLCFVAGVTPGGARGLCTTSGPRRSRVRAAPGPRRGRSALPLHLLGFLAAQALLELVCKGVLRAQEARRGQLLDARQARCLGHGQALQTVQFFQHFSHGIVRHLETRDDFLLHLAREGLPGHQDGLASFFGLLPVLAHHHRALGRLGRRLGLADGRHDEGTFRSGLDGGANAILESAPAWTPPYLPTAKKHCHQLQR
eukprot:scaffold7052_cov254-Pinguiococcus_pyrenoidosus.AAC.61